MSVSPLYIFLKNTPKTIAFQPTRELVGFGETFKPVLKNDIDIYILENFIYAIKHRVGRFDAKKRPNFNDVIFSIKNETIGIRWDDATVLGLSKGRYRSIIFCDKNATHPARFVFVPA